MEPSGKTAPGKPAAQPDAAGKLPIDGLPDDPEPADPAELARFREASAIATRFTDWYVANHGPIIARGKARPYCALRDAVVDVLKAGYDEREIRRALANLAEPVPGTSRLQAAVVEVRSGQRPGSSTSQRRGNVHISDMDDDDRNAQRRAWGGGS